MIRKLIGAAALVALLALRIEPKLWQFPTADRRTMNAIFIDKADHNWLAYIRFLNHVREVTPRGAKIMIVVPTDGWDNGYAYAYYRACYFLVGRDVLPLVWNDNLQHLENLRAAEYLALWRVLPPRTNARTVWQGDEGILLKR